MPGNFFMGEGPYKQSGKKDVWLPLETAAVWSIVRAVPVLLLSPVEAILIGRAMGPLILLPAIALAIIASRKRKRPTLNDLIPMIVLFVIGVTFCALWVLDAWPASRGIVQYKFKIAEDAIAGIMKTGHPYVMWSVFARAFEPMGAWLFWRIAFAVAIPYALIAPLKALNFRYFLETQAPTAAERLRYGDVMPEPELEQRSSSSLQDKANADGYF